MAEDAVTAQSNAEKIAASLRVDAPAPTPGMPGMPGEPAAPAAPAAPTPPETTAAPPAAEGEQPAAELSDEELFGDVDDPFGEPDLDASDDSSSDDEGFDEIRQPITDENIQEMKSILGSKADGFTREEIKTLHDKVIFGTPKGQRYRQAFKFQRDLSAALGREISSPDDVLAYARSAQTFDQMVDAVKSSKDGAKAVLRELTQTGRGEQYPWAAHVREAANELFGADTAEIQKEAETTAISNLIDALADRAADHYRNGEKDHGLAWLDAANRIHHVRFGAPLPQRGDIQQGRYDKKSSSQPAPRANGAPPPPESPKPSDDPEKEQLRQRLAQLEQQEMTQRMESWGDQASDVFEKAARTGLAALKTLVDRGTITDRVYNQEVAAYVDRLYDEVGQDAAEIAKKARTAISRNDRDSLSWLTGQLRAKVSAAMRRTRLEHLQPYRQAVADASSRTANAQTRTKQAGEKTDTTTGSQPVAPAVTTKTPPGDQAGNAAWIAKTLAG